MIIHKQDIIFFRLFCYVAFAMDRHPTLGIFNNFANSKWKANTSLAGEIESSLVSMQQD